MATYMLNDSKMFSDIADGIAIIINSETGIYYGLNGIATVIFDNLTSGASQEAILEALMALPDAPGDMAERLDAFINELKEFEIIIETDDAGAAEATISADMAQADEFIPVMQEYSDAQELLLADPIHEVKDNTGWQPDKGALETDTEVVKAKEAKLG